MNRVLLIPSYFRSFFLALLLGSALFVYAGTAYATSTALGAPPFVQQDQDPASFVGALYSYSLTIVAAAAVIMIVYGGVKYVASGGSVSARSDAMDIIKNAIFGVVLLFGAYIILYTINPALVQLKNPAAPTAPDVQTPPGGSGGNCSITATPSSGKAPLTVSFSSSVDSSASFSWIFGDGTSGTGSSPSHTFQKNGIYSVSLSATAAATANASSTAYNCATSLIVGNINNALLCTAPSSGPCSVANLQNTCFGSNAAAAGGICNIESSGNQYNLSKGDKCLDASGKYQSVSVGLFQINISANQIGGLNCPSAFDKAYAGCNVRKTCGPCHILNPSLYAQCVQAAQDASANIAKACSMSGNGTNWSQWGPDTLSKCGIHK